ncbi:patatin-like phospholipase family protein [Lysobacter brunescens]|uniref:Patatin-like phospholipase family protein n=1 Tax=Lysobacter brunescens TaxID=262323 RepID=A0ABW2YDG3_9GAMM
MRKTARQLAATLALSLAYLVAPAPARAADFDTCLVLSGGGARGMAHIGVIKVLERERIPVDCIVGTSMGAVVGSLYASGLTATEIETQMRALDWNTMFVDRIDRSVFPARRKAEDRSFLAKGGFGLRDGKVGVPPSLFEGQRLAVALRAALLPSATIPRFDDLPIPYRAVGTDLETGDAVAMDSGDLVNAVRASMAVPGAFSPVSYGERSLIDGGVAMNLPVEIAQKWGARRIIAVDIAAKLKSRDQLLDPFSITDQMITALMQKESQRQRDRLGPRDVLIVPELADLGSADFTGGMDKGVALGEAATVAALPQLQAMRVSEADYAAWRTARAAKLRPIGTIDRVELANTSGVDDEAILARMSAKPGEAVDAKKIEQDLGRLYGLGEFSRVYYTIESDDCDDTVLTYVARSRRWEEDGTLKLGLLMQDDFEGQGEYQLGARYGRRELNRFGGELLLEARIGDRNRAFAELHQPLTLQRTVFFRPSLEWRGENETLLDGGNTTGEYRYSFWQARTGLGAVFGDWGEASIAPFARRNHFDLRRDSVSTTIPRTTTSAGLDLNFVVDTQDDAEFPSKGWYVQARHTRYLPILDAETRGFTSRFNANLAFTGLGGRWQLGLRSHDRRGSAFEDVATLGGPFRLSGYGIDTLRGNGAALGTLQFNYPLAQVMEYPLFVGGSLEAGQLWGRGQEPSLERTIFGGSVYTALDTPLGPIYFGLGLAEGGEEAVFFRLGQPD